MKTGSLDIIVAGAGIGGLGAALALQRAGHRVRLLERTQALRPVGAAISIWPNGVRVLRALGVGEALDASAGTMARMSYHDRDGSLMARFSLQPLYDAVQERAKPVARMALQRLLLDAVGEHHVQLGAQCERYEQDDTGVTVHMADGSTQRADLFVVSDGSRSTLRNQVAGQSIARRYRGYVNWNGRVRTAPALGAADEWHQYVGDHKRVSLMPMGGDEFYFFFDVPVADPTTLGLETPRGASTSVTKTSDDPERHRQALSDYFEGWAPAVRALIARMDPASIASVAIHDTDPVPTLVDGRVVLIGDAAHAMAPDLGQGGCQALEDAWVLAQALAPCNAGSEGSAASAATMLETALRAYEQQRLPRVHGIVERARKRAAVIHGDDPAQTQAWYDSLRVETGTDVIAGLRKTAEGGPL